MPTLPDPDRDARFTKLWNEGLAIAVIAIRLGIDRTTVRAMRIRLGLPERSRK